MPDLLELAHREHVSPGVKPSEPERSLMEVESASRRDTDERPRCGVLGPNAWIVVAQQMRRAKGRRIGVETRHHNVMVGTMSWEFPEEIEIVRPTWKLSGARSGPYPVGTISEVREDAVGSSASMWPVRISEEPNRRSNVRARASAWKVVVVGVTRRLIPREEQGTDRWCPGHV